MFRALVTPMCVGNNKLNLSLKPKCKIVPKMLIFKTGNPSGVFCFVSFMRITNALNNLRLYHDLKYGCEKNRKYHICLLLKSLKR